MKKLKTKLHYISQSLWSIRSIKVILLILILVGLLMLILSYRAKNKKEEETIHSRPQQDTRQDIKDGLINIPKDAKSEVCEALPSNKIEDIIGSKLNGARVSIPTTKTAEGIVSACAYEVIDKDKTLINSIIITRRKFNNASNAQKAFGILSRMPDDNRQLIDKFRYFNTKTGQVVVIRDDTLTVFAISKISSKAIDESIYRKLAEL